MTDPDLTEREPHDEAEELLPWYATGQLGPSDRIRVEAHLSSCAECREQLSLERRLVQEFRAMTPELESGWARLRARMSSPPPRSLRPKGPNPLAQFWQLISRPAVAGLVAAQLAFVIIAGSVLMSLSRPAYHVLGSAPAPASANLIVMFKGDARIGDVASALKTAGASIVEGPTEADAYLLHVDPQQRRIALQRLKSNGHVALAEPIDGTLS